MMVLALDRASTGEKGVERIENVPTCGKETISLHRVQWILFDDLSELQ